jgi:hypothetical protein
MRLAERIDHANAEAARRLTASRARWVDVRPLRDVVLDLGAYELTHGGPPLLWREMGGAQRGAVLAAVVFEGWAATPAEARGMLDRAEVCLRPNHHAGGVGPGAGVGSPTTPVCVVEERGAADRQGARAWAPLALPGVDEWACDASAVALRRRWRDALGPALARAVASVGGVDLDELVARALHMGDDGAQRTTAATALTAAALAPALAAVGLGGDDLRELFAGLTGEGFFGALAMAAAKLACDGARSVEDSTVVTAVSRNGARCGVRLAGTGDRWFTAAAPTVRARPLDGRDDDEAGRDLGDSSIAETAGLGAFALAGAPALHARYGTRVADGLRVTRDMGEITVARHPRYTLPALEFAGAPVGIDARRVVDTGILPVIGATVVHREAGHRPVGSGLTRVPRECFTAAVEAFAADRGIK